MKPFKAVHHAQMLSALTRIAGGKLRGAKPFCGEEARQIAREVLVEIGERWPKQVQYFKVETVNGQAELRQMDEKAA